MNVNARVASCRSDFVVGNIGGFLVDASNALYRAARETAGVVVDVQLEKGGEEDKGGARPETRGEPLDGGTGVGVERTADDGADETAEGVGHVIISDVDGHLVPVGVFNDEIRVNGGIHGEEEREDEHADKNDDRLRRRLSGICLLYTSDAADE